MLMKIDKKLLLCRPRIREGVMYVKEIMEKEIYGTGDCIARYGVVD
jgi:hypothetical protein